LQGEHGNRRNRLSHRPRDALVAALVSVAYRLKSVGRTEKEILAMCSCSKKQLARVLRGVNTVVQGSIGKIVPVVNAVDLVRRFCSHLRMPYKVSIIALHIISEIDKRGLCSSRLVSSRAGAAIFMSCLAYDAAYVDYGGLPLLQAVSLATGAAETTIKEVCKVLYTFRDVLIPVQYAHVDLSVMVCKGAR
jgi:transcription initiation factor TFIIB